MAPSTSSPISAICKDLESTLAYEAGLRSCLHRSSLSLSSNAYLPISLVAVESVRNDWIRHLLLDHVALKFDEFDAELVGALLEKDGGAFPFLSGISNQIALALPDVSLDQMVLDDVVFHERMQRSHDPFSAPDRAAALMRAVGPSSLDAGPDWAVETSGAISAFRTASEQMCIDEQQRLGGRKRTPGSGLTKTGAASAIKRSRPVADPSKPTAKSDEFQIPPELDGLNLSASLVESIMCEIMDKSPGVQWHDIAGLDFAKKCIREIVVWPMIRPDLFKGLRGPPKGLLLFGPPGTGKTMIGRAIASECRATFFSISSSSLTSKWHGESEKLVRTLFAVARCYQPAVIFVDEIDSLLAQRSDSEFEGSRRLKTEFLVQLDGAATSRDDRVLLIGATNRPQELDEAARRRLVKRLFIPLPDAEARRVLIRHLVEGESHTLDQDAAQMHDLIVRTKGYSGADINALCTEASYGPIRDLPDIADVRPDQVRAISFDDFRAALGVVRASVSLSDLGQYHEWNDQFGSFPIDPVMT